MKITFFINTLSSGGAEHQLCILANMLESRGYDISIATYGDSADHYPLRQGINRIWISRGLNKYQKLIYIWKFFLTLKSDWVIIFDQRNSLYALPPLFLNKKISVMCGERNFNNEKLTFAEKILISLLYRRATFVVSNNYTQERFLRSYNKNLDKKLSTIINYTDLKEFIPGSDASNEKIVIGVLARYTKQKNYVRFCKAVKMLYDKYGNVFQVKWCGRKFISKDILEPGYKELSALIKEYGIENTFQINDHIKDTKMFLQSIDFFCLPSLHEGFSNALAEAICCGKPVIASDVSDNSVMVHEGVNGFLFDPLIEENIFKALERALFIDKDESKKMSLNSRNIAESIFSEEKFAQSYIDLLNTRSS